LQLGLHGDDTVVSLKRRLGEEELVRVYPVVGQQQPTGAALRDGVHAVADHPLRHLIDQHLCVAAEQVVQRSACSDLAPEARRKMRTDLAPEARRQELGIILSQADLHMMRLLGEPLADH
jgi:hypothetical protein